MEAKLAAMREGKVAVVSPETRAAEEALSVALFAEWTRRRRIFRDVYDAVLESCETKPAKLKEEVRRAHEASQRGSAVPRHAALYVRRTQAAALTRASRVPLDWVRG